MAHSYFSAIDFVQGCLVREAIITIDQVAVILSDKSPSLTYKDKSKQCPAPPFSMPKLTTNHAMVSPKDAPSFEGRLMGLDVQKKLADLQTKDAEYLNTVIGKSIERYQRTIDFYRYLLQSISRPCSEEPAPASAPAEEDQVPASPSPAENEYEQSNSSSSRCTTPIQPATIQEVTKKRASVVELNEPESPRTVNTIDFKDVYRGGTSATTHFILDYEHSLKATPMISGRWWILRCEQCDWHGLSERPGSFHMEHHPELRIDDLESAIETFGVLVRNCTRDLADTNNTHVRKVMQDRASEPSTARARHKNKRRKVVKISVSPRSFTERQLITDPSVGEMYLAGWSDGKLYGAVALPLGDFMARASIPGSMWDSGLLSSVPRCYRVNKRARHFTWAEGYEDGGTNVGFRQFPLFYFDNPKVEDGHVGWAYAHDLHPFDLAKITSGLTRPAALYAKHYQKANHTPFSHELFSHHEGQMKPVPEQIPSPNHPEGEKSSSASSTPQTTSTEADTDMSHGKKIAGGQGGTPSSDGFSHSAEPLFDESKSQPGTSEQIEDATFDSHTDNSPGSAHGISPLRVGIEQRMPPPDARMMPHGEPGHEAIVQPVQPRNCHPSSTVNTETWLMFPETHNGQAFTDAIENSAPIPHISSQLFTTDGWIIHQNGDD
ncbi:unnamed protein product [Clonostachys solani]|uniref:Uncharacterized protein n=1 Tax=Clonostachys solani TaxID=160281 RepID=A0A9N9ZHC4_9HYPO|nr:unnamed protein product [Clonostachys solani]